MATSPQKICSSKGKSLLIPHAPSLGTHLNPSFTSIVSPIWSSLSPIHSLNEFHSPSAFDWIKKMTVVNDTPSKYPYILWKFIFPFTAWSIWSTRNKFAMENTPFSPNETIDKTLSLSTDHYYSLPATKSSPYPTSINICWHPPLTGYFKLNTDRSILHSNPTKASAGGLIRDSLGSWIGGFTRKIGITHSMVAELWGLRDGLTLAKQLNIKKLYVETDAKAMVTLICNPTSIASHPCSSLIYDCRHLLQLFEEAHIHHIFREGNHCADLLAKEGASSNDNFILYSSPPPFLLYQLYADS